MKTIEERAIEKYPITAENADKAIAMRKIYVQIATEQKAIDDDHFREVKKMLIDKACKAHCSCCMAYKACSHRNKFYCWELDKIRKAMEG